MRRFSTTALIAVTAAAVLAVYLLLWLSVTDKQIGRSDFTSTYMGATLWRDGHRADLYDRDLQAKVHAELISPDVEGNLPFVNPPTAAVVATPLTFFGLHTAYRIWALLQVAMLIASVAVVRRALSQNDIAVSVIALAIPGTLALLLLGQWDGITALAVALTFWSLKKERHATAGAILAAGMLLAKPHLGLGLAAFALGLWRPRMIAGGVIAGVAWLVANFAAVGTAGMHGYVDIEFYDASRWNLASFLGFNGFFEAWLNNPSLSQIVGWIGGALSLVAAAWLGYRARRGSALEGSFAAAVALSLVMSPHLLSHDLVLLCPALLLAAATYSVRVVAAGWLLLCLASFLDFGKETQAPPGRLVPVVLAASAIAMVVAEYRGGKMRSAAV